MFLNLAAVVCAGIGFVSGLAYLRPRQPLYAAMIVMGTGCIVLDRFYRFACLLCGLPLAGVFQPGVFGMIAASSFFFSANYGQIDSLVDDGSHAFQNCRRLAAAAPALACLLYGFVLFSPAPVAEKITGALVFLTIGAASYYHLKHLLIPDVEYGVVRCLRRFNALALLYSLLVMTELIAQAQGFAVMQKIAVGLLCPVCGILIPVMDKGVKAWRT